MFEKKINNVLDITLPTLKRKISISKIVIIAGQNYQAIKKIQYNNVEIIKNNKWNKFGNLYSLSLALKEVNGPALILYGDILFNP